MGDFHGKFLELYLADAAGCSSRRISVMQPPTVSLNCGGMLKDRRLGRVAGDAVQRCSVHACGCLFTALLVLELLVENMRCPFLFVFL